MNNNWVKTFNEMERNKQGEVLELMDRIEKFRSETLNDIVVEIYTLSQESDNLDFFELDIIELMDKVDYLHNKFNNMILKYNDKIQLIDVEVDNIIDKVNEIIKDMSVNASNFVKGNVSKYSHNINGNMVRGRLFVFRKRIITILNEFLDSDSSINSEIDYTRDTISILKKQALRRVNKEYKSLENSMKESKKTKIFDYKEMNRLAKLKGYEADHCTGDHLILVHRDSRKSIVVPQKELGKGLSFEIQKQMKNNSI